MKKLITISSILLPCVLSAQTIHLKKDEDSGKWGYSKIYNVYNRTAGDVMGYAEKYLSTLVEDDSKIQKDTNNRTVSLPGEWEFNGFKSTCVQDAKFNYDIIISAKDGRTKIDVTNIRYIAERSDCQNEGTLEALFDCKECKSVYYIKEQLSTRLYKIVDQYHEKLRVYTTSSKREW